jgi:hypothetical protein
MGWGVTFNPQVFISREHYSSEDEVKEKITELTADINSRKMEIAMYISSTPKDVIPDDWKEDGMIFLNNKLESALNDITEMEIHIFKLRLLLDHLLFHKDVQLKDLQDKYEL